MKLEVSNCIRCPFYDLGHDGHCSRPNCEHPKINFRDIETVSARSPDWCPLRTENIEISWGGK